VRARRYAGHSRLGLSTVMVAIAPVRCGEASKASYYPRGALVRPDHDHAHTAAPRARRRQHCSGYTMGRYGATSSRDVL
jgi:hypothetical protein